jgi:hypothetical protein
LSLTNNDHDMPHNIDLHAVSGKLLDCIVARPSR